MKENVSGCFFSEHSVVTIDVNPNSRYWRLKLENGRFSLPLPCLTLKLGGTRQEWIKHHKN